MPRPPAPLVLADRQRVGAVAPELVLNRLLARPRARVGLESGRAPATMFAALRAHATAGELPRGAATGRIVSAPYPASDHDREQLRALPSTDRTLEWRRDDLAKGRESAPDHAGARS
jgi:hypothetical protein